jgi:hypothetical protein
MHCAYEPPEEAQQPTGEVEHPWLLEAVREQGVIALCSTTLGAIASCANAPNMVNRLESIRSYLRDVERIDAMGIPWDVAGKGSASNG